jgi:hypothetical protein
VTTYTVAWGWDDTDPSGQNTILVRTVEEMDAALDRIAALAAADDEPRWLNVYEGLWAKGEPATSDGFQMLWGHPERAALTWLGDDPAVAYDPSLPEWPEPIGHDQGLAYPWRTRVTPEQAREAVREWLRTRERPTNVLLDPEYDG